VENQEPNTKSEWIKYHARTAGRLTTARLSDESLVLHMNAVIYPVGWLTNWLTAKLKENVVAAPYTTCAMPRKTKDGAGQYNANATSD
jgi:hypothetical protein